MADPFIWSNAKVPFTIKKGDDDPNAQDLETSTTRAEPEKKARLLIRARTGNQNEPNEYYCRSAIEARIGNGGAEPLNLAQFFFKNKTAQHVFECPNDSFWSNTVRKDAAFQTHHAELVKAIEEELNFIASSAGQSPIRLDPNLLEKAKGPLEKFATHLSFSFTKDPSRLASGDPLAFGIGDIQGIEVKISSFHASNDGAFSLNLDYEIWDHFGSNDGDLYDNAQACLWLLQRKKIKDQDKQAFMPFRIKIVLKNVAGSGKVSQPAGLQYDWRGRPYQE